MRHRISLRGLSIHWCICLCVHYTYAQIIQMTHRVAQMGLSLMSKLALFTSALVSQAGERPDVIYMVLTAPKCRFNPT